MSQPDLQRVKQALLDAGIEIYRVAPAEIQVAERVRLHIMDSGVRVRLNDDIAVQFTARSQRSDAPSSPAEELFDRVREKAGNEARERGYEESCASTVEVTDPVDHSKVLDVWHEITYCKRCQSPADAVDEVRWALAVEKYVTP